LIFCTLLILCRRQPRARTLVTIHDLSYMVHPECAVPGVAAYLRDAVPRALKQASIIIADSESTRRDLHRLLNIALDRVTVVYPGVDARFRPLPPEVCEPVRRRLNLPRRFILFVGTIEPRKNLVRLLEAFARIDRAVLNDRRGEDLFLVLAGRRGWMYQPVFAAIDRLNLRDRVQLLDFVADSDLPVVYNLAQVFVYPSLYEGFGLPPLEALACGTPVVTSDNSSLPEVVGNAALLARADDVEALFGGDDPPAERRGAAGSVASGGSGTGATVSLGSVCPTDYRNTIIRYQREHRMRQQPELSGEALDSDEMESRSLTLARLLSQIFNPVFVTIAAYVLVGFSYPGRIWSGMGWRHYRRPDGAIIAVLPGAFAPGRVQRC
jgi:hypothetical protein